MIKSTIIKNSDSILSILSDPKGLTKLVKDLKKADTDAKESLKELTKGKALCAFSKSCEKEVEEYKSEVDKAKKQLKSVKDKADKYESEVNEKLALREMELLQREQRCTTLSEQVARTNLDADDRLKQAQRDLKKAQGDMAEAKSLKQQYEEQLADIKARLSGL